MKYLGVFEYAVVDWRDAVCSRRFEVFYSNTMNDLDQQISAFFKYNSKEIFPYRRSIFKVDDSISIMTNNECVFNRICQRNGNGDGVDAVYKFLQTDEMEGCL